MLPSMRVDKSRLYVFHAHMNCVRNFSCTANKIFNAEKIEKYTVLNFPANYIILLINVKLPIAVSIFRFFRFSIFVAFIHVYIHALSTA